MFDFEGGLLNTQNFDLFQHPESMGQSFGFCNAVSIAHMDQIMQLEAMQEDYDEEYANSKMNHRDFTDFEDDRF